MAKKRYERRILIIMSVYVAVLFSAGGAARHGHFHGPLLYLLAVLPAVPIILVIGAMGRYLQEETDEYQRMLTVQSLLVGTGVLLACLVVNDFLRAYAGVAALPEFVSFVLFFTAVAITGGVQTLVNRAGRDDE